MAKKLKKLNSTLKNLDGVEITEVRGPGNDVVTVTAKGLLSTILLRGASEDPVRMMDCALKVHGAEGSLVLDDVDIAAIQACVLDDRMASNLAKSFLIKILDAAEEVKG